ncbi:hypothetical protein [Clostridium sp. Marseille-Q7071]
MFNRLSLTVIIGLLTVNVSFKRTENRINCLEDNVMDNMGEITAARNFRTPRVE